MVFAGSVARTISVTMKQTVLSVALMMTVSPVISVGSRAKMIARARTLRMMRFFILFSRFV